jgi:protein-disulfide isomerase
MNRKLLFAAGTGLIVLAFIIAVVLYRQMGGIAAGNGDIVERADAPLKGPRDASVTIVEFFDPACGTCAQFQPLVQQLTDRYPGKVRVMMRYAPLHTGSDQVVAMLEAAHRQGKYWQALDVLFQNQSRWIDHHVADPVRARRLLNSVALDHARLDIDARSASVAEVVQQDLRDLQALGVRATPEFFVNGKPLPSFGFRQLAELVEEAVKEAH